MISVDLARALRTAGLRWQPANGDWFVVDTAELLDQRLVLSDMTVDVKRVAGATVLGFNGTTEWALDSVGLEDTLWLPNEGQLRDHLGVAFCRLEHDGERWVVSLELDGAPVGFAHPDCAEAYGRAVLHLLTR